MLAQSVMSHYCLLYAMSSISPDDHYTIMLKQSEFKIFSFTECKVKVNSPIINYERQA